MGSAVSVATRVGVCVGKKIGVTVAAGEAVNEGSGVIVHVGVIVGVVGTIKRSPPHAMRNKASSAIPISRFCKRLQRMIQIPENSQSLEREPGGNDLDYICFLRDDRRKPACCNHLHIIPQLLAESIHHPLYHADIAK